MNNTLEIIVREIARQEVEAAIKKRRCICNHGTNAAPDLDITTHPTPPPVCTGCPIGTAGRCKTRGNPPEKCTKARDLQQALLKTVLADSTVWRGNARKLSTELKNSQSLTESEQSLFKYECTLGKHIAHLARIGNVLKIRPFKTDGIKRWRIGSTG